MKNHPFLLTPAAKDYLWGGNRLNEEFGKGIPLSPLAETWECSTHPDGQSLIEGIELRAVLQSHPEWLGTHPLQTVGENGELPILVKLIDAKADLSVQVHPNDEYAWKNEHSLGKTEMWYVLDAKPGAELIYGFNQDTDQSAVKEAVANGTILKLLNRIPVRKNDLFYIEAGTVHAIGAGILLAEVQENSNLTYRLYDYDRIGKNGKKRDLHLDKALQVAKFTSSERPRQPMRLLHYRNGIASELLARCRYFQVERLLLNTEIQRNLATFQTGSNSFHVFLCLDGCGVLFGEGVTRPFFKGDCVFIPAESIPLKLHGNAQLLDISC